MRIKRDWSKHFSWRKIPLVFDNIFKYIATRACLRKIRYIQCCTFESKRLIEQMMNLTDLLSLNGDASSLRDNVISHWAKELLAAVPEEPVGRSYGVTTSTGRDWPDWITFHRRMRPITYGEIVCNKNLLLIIRIVAIVFDLLSRWKVEKKVYFGSTYTKNVLWRHLDFSTWFLVKKINQVITRATNLKL